MPLEVLQQNEPLTQTATIAASGNLSAAVRLPNGHELAAIIMPATWTAAGITFKAGPTAATVADVFDTAGDEVALTAVAAHYVPIPPGTLHGAIYLKIRSGTSGTPVAQAAERTLTLITRPTA